MEINPKRWGTAQWKLMFSTSHSWSLLCQYLILDFFGENRKAKDFPVEYCDRGSRNLCSVGRVSEQMFSEIQLSELSNHSERAGQGRVRGLDCPSSFPAVLRGLCRDDFCLLKMQLMCSHQCGDIHAPSKMNKVCQICCKVQTAWQNSTRLGVMSSADLKEPC